MGWLSNLSSKILQVTHGRTTAFLIAFFVSGNVLAYIDKLTPVYVAFMGTLGGLVLGHSIKEDIVAGINGPPAPSPDPGGPDVNK
jgi:hypothetical protein